MNYVELIGEHWPGVQVSCYGNPSVWNDVIYHGGNPMPSQQDVEAIYLPMRQQRVWKKIQNERTRRQQGGVYAASIDRWFHSDADSRVQFIGLLLMGANLPSGIMWKTMSGAFVEMTIPLAQEIFNSIAALDLTAFHAAEIHKAAMYACQDPETYDFSAGWPVIYA